MWSSANTQRGTKLWPLTSDPRLFVCEWVREIERDLLSHSRVSRDFVGATLEPQYWVFVQQLGQQQNAALANCEAMERVSTAAPLAFCRSHLAQRKCKTPTNLSVEADVARGEADDNTCPVRTTSGTPAHAHKNTVRALRLWAGSVMMWIGGTFSGWPMGCRHSCSHTPCIHSGTAVNQQWISSHLIQLF